MLVSDCVVASVSAVRYVFTLDRLQKVSARRSSNSSRASLCLQTCLSAAALVGAVSAASVAHAQTYVGQARVANVTALSLLGVDVFNTGNLPSIGGSLSTGSLPVNVDIGIPPITTAAILDANASLASTTGSNGTVTSQAGLSAVSLLGLNALRATVLAPTVSIGAITAFASADVNGTFGFSDITNLQVGGQLITLNTVTINGQIHTAPNQVLDVAGVKLIVNQQTTDANGTLTVNALRVQASPLGIGAADIVLGTARAGFTPASSTAPEPGSLALLSLGSLGLASVARKRRH